MQIDLQGSLPMTDVLFGQSYYLRFDPKLWAAMQPYPPLGTLYACAHVRALGFDVALFDAMLAKAPSEWDDALARHRPRYAVLYEDSFNYLSKMCLLEMRRAAFEMIAMARRRGCTVIVSASDATDHVAEYLDAGADYVLIGEAELTLGELLQQLSSGEAHDAAIPGVAARGLTPRPRPPLRDLDGLPFPAWDLVDVGRYRRAWTMRHGYFSVNMVTTRGCPYACNWCAKPIYGRQYQARSPANVVAEMRWLRDTVRPDRLTFCDDIFGLKPGWIAAFAELVRREDLRLPFKCLLRADLVDDNTARQLAQAGCQTVWMGVESGSQDILDAMDKGTTVEDTRRATRALRAAGIDVGYFLQFGYPGEGWREIQSTLRLVRECQPDDIGVSVAYPLPGTVFHERVRAQLGPNRNWNDGNDLAMLYTGPYPTAFYRQLHRTLHHEFRGRKAVRALRRGEAPDVRGLAHAAVWPWHHLRLQWMRSAFGQRNSPHAT